MYNFNALEITGQRARSEDIRSPHETQTPDIFRAKHGVLINPPIGYRAQVWYRENMRWMPHHGKTGEIVLVGKRGEFNKPGPRNHMIQFEDGLIVNVPCGNLKKIEKPED